MSTKAKVTIGIIIAVALIGIIVVFSCLQRVDLGKVGFVVTYNGNKTGTPSIEPIGTGRYRWINPSVQHLFGYVVAQQTLAMVQKGNEGPVKGDDSVPCKDKNGIKINFDVRILWRVDPEKAAQLYILRPDVPLKGDFNNDIETLIVRAQVKTCMADAATGYQYDQLFKTQRMEYGKDVAKLLKAALAKNYLILDEFLLGEPYLEKEFADSIKNVGIQEQNAKAAFFLAQEETNKANAKVAAAEGDKQSAIKKAEGEQQAALLIQNQVGKDKYIEYLYAQAALKWEGTNVPSTVVIGGNGTLPPYILPGSNFSK